MVEQITKQQEPTQTKDFSFETELVKLAAFLPGSDDEVVPVGCKQGVMRMDTREVISTVGLDYNLVSHKEAVSFYEKMFKRNDIEFERKGAYVLQNGCTMFVRYALPEERDIFKYSKTKKRKKGDIVSLGFDLKNSLNGTTKLTFQVNALRLTCLNGMTTPHNIAGNSFTHRGHTHFSDKCEEIEELLSTFDDEVLPMWGRFMDTRISLEDAQRHLQTLNVPNKHRTAMWGQFEIADEHNYWDLYNSVTNRTTHSIAERNYGTAITVSNQSYRLLSNSLTGRIQNPFKKDIDITFMEV